MENHAAVNRVPAAEARSVRTAIVADPRSGSQPFVERAVSALVENTDPRSADASNRGLSLKDPAPDAIDAMDAVDPVTDVPCLGCGCLCDDVAVEARSDGGRTYRNACEIGLAWFAVAASEVDAPRAALGGAPADDADAVSQASRLLSAARAPVVFGLTRTSNETVREALALADRLRARVILNRTRRDLDRVAAFQNVGRIGATLGEVKNRSDVVVFWGCDPATTHPRHFERYSANPRGRFIPEGRPGRTLITIDDRPTPTATLSDLVLPLPPDRDRDLAGVLVRALRTGDADFGRLNLPAEGSAELLARLRGARHGAVFYQSRASEGTRSRLAWEGVSALVRALNEHSRFVLLGLGSPANVAGAEAVMTWQAGYPQGVDFAPGFPTALDETATLDGVLASRGADLLIVVADDWPDGLSESARAFLDEIPTVVVAPNATVRVGPVPAVALNSSRGWADETGTVTRVDGVVLPLRPYLAPRFPSARWWLRALLDGAVRSTTSAATNVAIGDFSA